MGNGHVLVIVTRISTFRRSILGFVGMIMAVTQTKFLPVWLG